MQKNDEFDQYDDDEQAQGYITDADSYMRDELALNFADFSLNSDDAVLERNEKATLGLIHDRRLDFKLEITMHTHSMSMNSYTDIKRDKFVQRPLYVLSTEQVKLMNHHLSKQNPIRLLDIIKRDLGKCGFQIPNPLPESATFHRVVSVFPASKKRAASFLPMFNRQATDETEFLLQYVFSLKDGTILFTHAWKTNDFYRNTPCCKTSTYEKKVLNATAIEDLTVENFYEEIDEFCNDQFSSSFSKIGYKVVFVRLQKDDVYLKSYTQKNREPFHEVNSSARYHFFQQNTLDSYPEPDRKHHSLHSVQRMGKEVYVPTNPVLAMTPQRVMGIEIYDVIPVILNLPPQTGDEFKHKRQRVEKEYEDTRVINPFSNGCRPGI